ncbi:DER1-domain-containing protein [Schizopora paradoxa]|uniref:Derlin n=1 Tax=Schizopora paradoxa TaxID=27342 RepID=A0A0H2RR21_9AGAM|nr:DER1-domain-containing protein [Schizopora paradoxa]
MAIADELRKIPPVTRFLCASMLLVTVFVICGITSVQKIIFVRQLVTSQFEIWRPFTTFFFGGTGIQFIFDFIMLYRNADALETSVFSGKSADFGWQLMFNCFLILVLNVPFNTFIHFRALLMTLVTLSSYLNPAALVSIFGLFQLQNQYFPYALLAIDLFVGGLSAALHALTGLIAGYVWWWLLHSPEAHAQARRAGRAGSWQRYAEAPALFRQIVGDGSRTGTGGGAEGAAAIAADRASAAAGRAGAAFRDEAHRWGTGRRLGGG